MDTCICTISPDIKPHQCEFYQLSLSTASQKHMVSKGEKEEEAEEEDRGGKERLQAPVLVMYLKIIQQHEDWGEEGVEMLTHVRVLDSKNKSMHRFSKILLLNQA